MNTFKPAQWLIAAVSIFPTLAFAMDIGKYSSISCRFHNPEHTVLTASLEPDWAYDEGDPKSHRYAEAEKIIDDQKFGLVASITPQPLFFIQLSHGSDFCEVEVLADDISGVNLMCPNKASGYCEFKK